MAEILKKVVALAKNSSKTWSLWLKFFKKVVALAEIIRKKGGRSG